MYVETELAKRHLQIDELFAEDDQYINHLIEVAECATSDFVRCELSDLSENGSSLPTPVKHAILLMVGNLYSNREPVAFTQSYKVPLSYEYLLMPYINYRG